MSKFKSYENICLQDTFIKALPEFSKWYDIPFAPQNIIITIDYPILKDISCYTGIDRIYEFLLCISWEQKFLNIFLEDYIISLLAKNNPLYEEMIENICEIVLLSVIAYILADKAFLERDFTENDCFHISKIFINTSQEDISCQIKCKIEQFFKQHYKNENEFFEYFSGVIDGIFLRIKNALKHQVLCDIF